MQLVNPVSYLRMASPKTWWVCAFFIFLAIPVTSSARFNISTKIISSQQGVSDGTCPTAEVLQAARNSLKKEVQEHLAGTPEALDRPCTCGGSTWSKIVSLDMTNSSHHCPSGLRTLTSPVRGCYQTAACSSAVYPVGRNYSQVCGRVNAIQYGTTDAFFLSIIQGPRTIEQEYLGGVSLTHGNAGSRKHIWSFAAAISEVTTDTYFDVYRRPQKCACTDTTKSWPYSTPSFVGDDYFCDTSNRGPGWSYTTYYTDNPMWDGKGCGPTSSCCEFNNPPWFCKTLSQATSDQIEMRICGSSSERSIVFNAEIFVK